MATNPYQDLPPERFWRTGVAESHPFTIEKLYKKKFPIEATDRIATAGSCFAQHVAKHMRDRGYNILDVEPPIPGTSKEIARKYGYGIYSARYGNIYTVKQLLQLIVDADKQEVRDEDIWERDGRYFDGLRPAVEPNGLSSPDEVRALRLNHLHHVHRLFHNTDTFIFTLGLTEAWRHCETKTVYPVCPGVIAGTFDEAVYEFHNFDYDEIKNDLVQIRDLLKQKSPNLRFLFTVSPVPLTATASKKHVLVATTYSKSTLRAVCGFLEQQFDDVDYFPAYEMIVSPFSRGFFYDANMRSVTTGGVDAVMRVFFSEHELASTVQSVASPSTVEFDKQNSTNDINENIACEEILLDAFAK